MKNIKTIANDIWKSAVKNKYMLLKIGTCTGVIGTAILTFRAGMKTQQAIDDIKKEGKEPTFKNVVKKTWKSDLPAGIAFVLTEAGIIFTDKLRSKDFSAMKAIIDVGEVAAIATKEELIEKFGEEKAKEIQNDINNRIAEKNPPTEQNTNVQYQDRQGYTLIRDAVTGGYFWDDINRVKTCVKFANQELLRRQEDASDYGNDDPKLTYSDILEFMGRQNDVTELTERFCTRTMLELNTNASGVCPENGLYPGHVYWSLQFWNDFEVVEDYL